MSDLDRSYYFFEYATFSDLVTEWALTDIPLYYYEFSWAGTPVPSWFTVYEIAPNKWLPHFQVDMPAASPGGIAITVLQKDWATGTLIKTITLNFFWHGLVVEPWNLNDCNTAAIAWLGPFGAWESYQFAGIQQGTQTGGKANTFINEDNETRYHDRGDIYQGAIVSDTVIPRLHIEQVANMQKSIQAFLWESGNVMTPILIKPKKMDKTRTRSPFIRYEFEFTHSQADTIQTQ